jgi:GT2 family glycosyltransferase
VEALDLSGPALAVCVATKDRPTRLRWLLNALAEQDLPASRFEVVVAHNSSGPATEELLRSHPLANLRHHTLAPGLGPAAMRNVAWRDSRARLIVFTDDDCRPPADWLSNYLAAAREHPGAILQGPTMPDPDELPVFHHAPHARSQVIEPPHTMAQTCNIAYPCEWLEEVGGFDESFPQAVGEDTDLALRARAAGAPYEAASEALTWHAVDAGLARRLRGTWRWQHMALLVRKHPSLRKELPLGGWAWKAEHARLMLALAGLAAARKVPALLVLAVPYVASQPRVYGTNPRGLARLAAELPGRAVLDAVETAALLRGSLRYRTWLL